VAIRKVLSGVLIPLLLSSYAIAWIAIQPALILLMNVLKDLLDTLSSKPIISQILVSLIYVLVNLAWLFSWYKIASLIRRQYLLKVKLRE